LRVSRANVMGSREVFQVNEIYRTIGSKLRFLREDKGYTLNQVCDLIYKKYSARINPNLLGKIERAESKIQTHIFLLLCKFYGVNSSFFINEKFQDENTKIFPNFDSMIGSAEGRELLLRISENSGSMQKLEIANDILRTLFPKLDLLIHQRPQEKSEFVLKAASPRRGKK